jgi:beta-N-acetylhexosaminidase
MRKVKKHRLFAAAICLAVLSSVTGKAQIPVFESSEAKIWSDSVLKRMTYDEKIGHLFMVAAFSNKDSAHIKYITDLIDSLKIGGLIFFQGGPLRQANLVNFYQSRSRIPLMIGIDGEWGLSMRLDSTIRFPRQMTLAAGGNDSLIYEMGKEIGRQCKRIGIHINFAPDVDINNNPANPVINSRSFGEDKFTVARLGKLYMKGMQDQKVLACAKHFPGHGNADTDSHYFLPVINQTAASMDSVELFPFRELINAGVGSVMVAHLEVPSLDTNASLASTLSNSIVTGLLKQKMGFKGLIITDALDMKGVANKYNSGELEFKALLAGNDILLNTENVYAAVSRIHFAIQNCEITQEAIDEHVSLILKAKHWCGLDHYMPIDKTDLLMDLKTEEGQWLNYRLYENSLTLLRNNDQTIPVKPFQNKKIASLVINDVKNNLFQQTLNNYAKVDCFSMSSIASSNERNALYDSLEKYDLVVASIHNTSTNATKNFNITEPMQDMVDKLSCNKKNVLCLFGNPYTALKFNNLDYFNAVILAYEDTYLPQYFTAQTIFGGNTFNGRLPVSLTDKWKLGAGENIQLQHVLKFSMPEEVVKEMDLVLKVDSIIRKAINDSVFPGCQVLAASNGKIFYNKAFGNPVYGDTTKVKANDLYDIASVTKIASTSLAVMYLYEHKKLDLNAKISKYLPELKKTNKANIILRDLMAHQAGLKSWIPFYKSTIDSGKLSSNIYSKTKEEDFTIPVADSVWMSKKYKEKIWNEIVASPVENPGNYVYSDLGPIILQRIVEKITRDSISVFVRKHFYEPLGLWKITFNPLNNFPSKEIIPTEHDTLFRQQLIHGYVHDPAAAMMGGVAGHAGLFANAQSLSVIMQMLLNYGTYNDKRYLKKETVELFTGQAFPGTSNRRGLLFDRPELNNKNSPAAASASALAFGHAGFTGTCAWADPATKLVYIFLSNRVYPSAENNQLAKKNIRTDIMELFYEAIR